MEHTSSKQNRLYIWLTAVSLLLAIPFVAMPAASAVIYEAIFGSRYETAEWMAFSASDYEGLTVERSDFAADRGVTLAGYCYSKAGIAPRGVVVVAHGLGGGGHNFYMPLIDRFTSGGYAVFAYDVRGNDNSGGADVEGLPQGVIDLDHALSHVAALPAYAGLPVVLFGHSWGAYSAGCVLELHPEVKAAVLVSGFDESRDMLLYQASVYVGAVAPATIDYVTAYERLKFGKSWSDCSVVESIRNSEAHILVVHSRDDETVPAKYGYDRIYEAFGDSEQVSFAEYTDRGHNYIFYSDAAAAYREELNAQYTAYVQERGGEHNAEIKTEFMAQYLDKKQCFAPDEELMQRILGLYDARCLPVK